MKLIVASLALILSTNLFAVSFVVAPAASTSVSSAIPYKTQAVLILNDAQEYMQSGKASVFLSQRIKEVQSVNVDASENDALEILVNEAQSVLN